MTPLTPRERAVLALVADGLTDKAIACELGLSKHTVGRLVLTARHKTGAASRAQLVAIVLRAELVG